jgi:hypothetical protein
MGTFARAKDATNRKQMEAMGYEEPPGFDRPLARLGHQLKAAFTDPTSDALIGGPMGVIPSALGSAKVMAPVTNKRLWPGTDINIYELTEDITDAAGKVLHPKNSTMADKTLQKYGYEFPPK